MEFIESRGQLARYDVRIKNLTAESALFGPEFSRRLGFDKSPPYPQSALLGELFYDLTHIYKCGANEAQSALLQQVSEELILGVWWVIKLEWNSGFKFPLPKKTTGKVALKKRTKPCGEWLQSVLHLAKKTITFYNFSGAELEHSSAAYWFHCIVKELAVTGGFSAVLPGLYPIQAPSKSPLLRKPGELNQYAFIGDLDSCCSRMKSFENPYGSGALTSLVRKGSQIAIKNDQFKKGAWDDFVKATRAYIRQMDTPDYQSTYIHKTPEGFSQLVQSKPGKGRAIQKIKPRTRYA